MRPQRKIHEQHMFYTIDHASEWFSTTDKTLAESVRDILDSIDPLPCPHDGSTVDLPELGLPYIPRHCVNCMEELERLPL